MWTPFVFFLQALFFIMPHYVWRLAEKGMMRFMTFKMKIPELDEDLRNKRSSLNSIQ